jgi:hypothetical protein
VSFPDVLTVWAEIGVLAEPLGYEDRFRIRTFDADILLEGRKDDRVLLEHGRRRRSGPRARDMILQRE